MQMRRGYLRGAGSATLKPRQFALRDADRQQSLSKRFTVFRGLILQPIDEHVVLLVARVLLSD
jgi:hypothetical protein